MILDPHDSRDSGYRLAAPRALAARLAARLAGGGRAVAAAYRGAFSGLGRGVWLLAVTSLVNRSGTMVLPFLVLYLTHRRGWTVGEAGQALALFGIGGIAGSFLGGRLSDLMSPRRVMIASLLGTGTGFLLLGRIERRPAILVTLLALSVISESFRPANSVAVAAASRPERLAQSVSLYRLALNLGMSVGPAAGGLLARVSYGWLFVVDGATSILAAAFLWAFFPGAAEEPAASRPGRPSDEVDGPQREGADTGRELSSGAAAGRHAAGVEGLGRDGGGPQTPGSDDLLPGVLPLGPPEPPRAAEPEPGETRGRLPTPGRRSSPWRDRPFLAFTALLLLLATVFFQITGVYTLSLHDVFGLSELAIGMVLAVNTLVIVAVEMVLVRALSRHAPLRLIAAGAFFFCCGLALLPLGSSLGFIVFTVLVWTLGEMLAMPAAGTFVAVRAGEESRGSYMGLYTSSFATAFVIAPLAGTWVYQRWGPNALWAACGLAGLVLCTGFSWLAVWLERSS